MKKQLLVSALCMICAMSAFRVDAQWNPVGPTATLPSATGAYPSLAKDPSNNLYLSYSTGLTGGFVQKYDGTNWNVLGTGAATPSSASYGNIGVTSTGDVYYGFQDGANSNKQVRKTTSPRKRAVSHG